MKVEDKTARPELWCTQLSPDQFDKGWLEDKLLIIPETWRPEVLKYIQLNDRVRSLAGRLLLLKALDKANLTQSVYENLKLSSFKRPFIFGLNAYDFSISHSDNIVLCATIQHGHVGVDVESIIRSVDFETVQTTMSEKQWEEIELAADPQATYKSFWTAKEALIKADGRGLYLPIQQIDIGYPKTYLENRIWNLKEIFVSQNYIAHLAWSTIGSAPVIMHVTL